MNIKIKEVPETQNFELRTSNLELCSPLTTHHSQLTSKNALKVTMYTDGAARGNPGRGGYGVVLLYNSHKKELSAGYKLTTNNRMELMAVIAGLEALKKEGLNVTIYSDSQYIVKAIEEGWLEKWVSTYFKGGKKNKDLWMRFYELAGKHHLKFIWVRGHAENIYNNRCDVLATAAADGEDLLVDEGYIQDNNSLFKK